MLQNSVLRVMLVFASMMLITVEGQAHVKWFVNTSDVIDSDFARYSLSDPAVMIWIAIALVLIISSVVLDSWLPSLPLVESSARRFIIALLSVCVGVSLLLTAYNGALIAPHYLATDGFGKALLVLEVVVGILLVSYVGAFLGGCLLLLLYLGLMLKFGFFETIEYWNMIGIAVFLIFTHFPQLPYRKWLKAYSVSVLRIFTGIALVTLGLSEKLLFAEYGEAFVSEYHWNFVQNFGLEFFSDRLFVLSAGMMEVVFGIILILGTTTRLNILVVSGFMLTSNITFFLEGNNEAAILEVIGHLPIIAIAVICVFFGSGQKFKITSLLNKKRI